MAIRVDKILALAALAVAAVILGGTILAFALHRAAPGALLRRAEPAPAASGSPASGAKAAEKTAAYTALGQIRTPTKPDADGKEPALVLVSPWFSYAPGDSAFYEELAAKNRRLKSIVAGYFSRFAMAELLKRGEDRVKAELLREFNDELTLGRISELYFDEYLFFD
jgi:flagellar basal body-associated protein FliL